MRKNMKRRVDTEISSIQYSYSMNGEKNKENLFKCHL